MMNKVTERYQRWQRRLRLPHVFSCSPIERLGMTVRKQLGTTPHGHRHAYGQRLKNGGVEPLLIQRCMHHVSEESQRVYTQATLQETVAALQDATRRIADRTAGLNVIQRTKEGWQSFPKT